MYNTQLLVYCTLDYIQMIKPNHVMIVQYNMQSRYARFVASFKERHVQFAVYRHNCKIWCWLSNRVP